MDDRTRRLLRGPIGPTLLRLAVPNVLVMLVQAGVGLIETAFVAGLGTDALAGMALVFPLVMTVQMISAGAVGGGVLSAVARALGAGRREAAEAVAWHAVAIGLALGLLTTALALAFGPALYRTMGAEGATLAAACAYGGVVFAGAVLIWLFNALAAVIRGTGNMALPAAVTCTGAAVLVPLSPALIFGVGPLPGLGIAGGGVAVLAYYAVGTAVLARYLRAGRGVLRLGRPPALAWAPAREILRVGAASSLVSLTTNVTIATATGLVARFGSSAVAGYGTGARLEYLLVPLVFGLGAPISAMVGTSIGAGDRARALRVAWTGAALAVGLTETIGLAAALWPDLFLRVFATDPAMLGTGARYLREVGPFYGFVGLGLSLYFAAQGAGRIGWPLAAGLTRLTLAVGGGWFALRTGAGLDGIFLAQALGLVALGSINAGSVAAGVWFRARPLPAASLAARSGA
ncbi:MATE family efflux transporter [Methylobacterium nodulans]|uniref:MATE efflux family protein n=1 Tax=Methylobacterium nodulans (strain LMG 21967 / CNCM I-2342 / ORS 2060) TaxID=460265 RepID=B8IU54_METNO|nr:MATE family efflux transporter [Methylobacterium nodulans]ACL55099.1 MATE efflux family protein [Methylobacterium nodulans ORS 2060]